MTIQTQLPMALRAAYLALHRRSDAQFASHGVTADQFVLLATLSRGQALTQRELARRMSSDPSTVRAMLVLLEKQGLVRRQSHPTDSRARTVALTAAGKRKFDQLWSAGEPIRAQMFDSIQPDEAALLIRLLTQVTHALQGDSVSAHESSSLESTKDES
jgi:DNA-binding MarR family transcriptional regulator